MNDRRKPIAGAFQFFLAHLLVLFLSADFPQELKKNKLKDISTPTEDSSSSSSPGLLILLLMKQDVLNGSLRGALD